MSPERNPSHNSNNSEKTLRERMLDDLQLRGLAERTQKGYLREVRKLAGYYNTSPDRLSEQQVADYLLHLINDRKFAAGSLNVAYNGIKFFFRHTVPRDWPLLTKLRLPKQKHKPDVLTIDEVHQLIGRVKQLHHRVYFWTIYSLGLRLEEGLNLHVGDIDSKRMMVHIHRGKGAKDRYLPLPISTLSILRNYWQTHRNPSLVFPAIGRDKQQAPTTNKTMNPSTVQGCMKLAVQELGLKKRSRPIR